MSMEKLLLFQGDDLPSIYFQIRCTEADCPLDLSDSTTKVYFKFRESGSTTLIVDAEECTKIDNGESGWVQFDWPATALDDLDAGTYEGELYVDYNGQIYTVGIYAWVAEPDSESNNMMFRLKEDF